MFKIANLFNLLLSKNKPLVGSLILLPLVAANLGCPREDSKKQADQTSLAEASQPSPGSSTLTSDDPDDDNNNNNNNNLGPKAPVKPPVQAPIIQLPAVPQPALPPQNPAALGINNAQPAPHAPAQPQALPQQPLNPQLPAAAQPQQPLNPQLPAPAQPQQPLNPQLPAPAAQPQQPLNPQPHAAAQPQQPLNPQLPAPAAQPQALLQQPLPQAAPQPNVHAAQANNVAAPVQNAAPLQAIPAAVNALENQARQYLQDLKTRKYSFFDPIMGDPIETLADLKAVLPIPLPADQTIVDDLARLRQTIEGWQTAGHKIKNEKDLKHVDVMLKKPGQFLDFIQLWQHLAVPDDTFYERIYHALNIDALLDQADFPDIADAALNGDKVAKRDYLIIALASIKNPNQNKILTNVIKADMQRNHYPTNGNSYQWFAEGRYKLYKIAHVIDNLNAADKASVLSNLLNAGKHCSDAKIASIEDALRIANFPALQHLTNLEDVLAINLQERMERVATKKKYIVLSSAIDVAWKAAINIQSVNASKFNDYKDLYLSDANWLLADWRQVLQLITPEEATYKASTWDDWATSLGLKKKGASNPVQRLVIPEHTIFSNGAYNTTALFNEIKKAAAVRDEILEKYAGCLSDLARAYENEIVRGALIDHGFFVNK